MRVNLRDFIAKFYLGNFMQFPTLKTYLNWAKAHAPKGPFAFIFAQDDIELTHTVAHHIKLGFRQTVVLADVPFTRPADLPAEVAFIARAAKSSSDISQEMNAIISALPQQWIYCGYNGEYLFYPFCESRSIGEIIAFNTEERRKTIPTTVVDLYAGIWDTARMGWMSQTPISIGLGITQKPGGMPNTGRLSSNSISTAACGGALRSMFHGTKGALIAWLFFKACVG
jgi:hypothetical protein